MASLPPAEAGPNTSNTFAISPARETAPQFQTPWTSLSCKAALQSCFQALTKVVNYVWVTGRWLSGPRRRHGAMAAEGCGGRAGEGLHRVSERWSSHRHWIACSGTTRGALWRGAVRDSRKAPKQAPACLTGCLRAPGSFRGRGSLLGSCWRAGAAVQEHGDRVAAQLSRTSQGSCQSADLDQEQQTKRRDRAARRMSAAAAVRRPWQHICTAPPTGHVVFTCETSRQQHETAQVFMPALLLPRIPATHTRHFSATALWSRLFTLHLPPAMPKRSTCQ